MDNTDRDDTHINPRAKAIWNLCQAVYREKARHKDYIKRDFVELIKRATEIVEESETTPPTESVEGTAKGMAVHAFKELMKALELISETIVNMKHAKIFITSKQKMNPTGVEQWDEHIEALMDFRHETKAAHPAPESEELIDEFNREYGFIEPEQKEILRSLLRQARQEEQVSMINRFESCMIDMDTENGTLIVDLDKYGPEFDEIKGRQMDETKSQLQGGSDEG